MKKATIATVFVVCSISVLLASTDPIAQQLLITAKQQASLFHDRTDPLQLDVDFVAQANVPVRGHLTLKWAAKDRWWRKVVFGDFEQINIRDGDKLYTSRNASFTPVRVGELISLLSDETSERLQVKNQRQRVDNGLNFTCLTVERENIKAKPHELCINSVSHDIASDEWQEPPDERRAELYTDYFDVVGRRYPRKRELLINGSRAITANVDSVTATAFDPTLLVPPKGAIERRQCADADMKRAVPLRTPDPAYPKSASQNRLMGDTIVAMTVLTDGSVTDIQLIGSATRSMDEATLQTLTSWRFKPAMCGVDAVVSDIQVVVSFRLH